MKNCGIVCEYNPFHTGHKYQLDRVRERGADNIVCVMSGAFVQSALPAFCYKALRAKCAVTCGADAVIELPAVYANASAQYFAEGAIKILREIKDLTHIAMGARADGDVIMRLADIKISAKRDFERAFKKYSADGKSYNAATVAALSEIYADKYGDGTDIGSVMSDPNNILCIEYITAVDKLGANIQPVIIERKGSVYNDIEITGEFASATALRNAFLNNNGAAARRFIPCCFDEISAWHSEHAADMSAYEKIATFALRCADTERIKSLRNCSEGLEHLIKNKISRMSLNDLFAEIVGKRYGKKRLNRLVLDVILDIDGTVTDKAFVTRLLACKNGFDFSILPELVKTNNADIKRAADDPDVAAVLDVDIKATVLFNTLCSVNEDYYNYSVVKA